MRWVRRGTLILLALLAIPTALFALYIKWLEFKQDRFYEARPILHAMWVARLSRSHEGVPSTAAEETLLRSFPVGSSRSTMVGALSAEGFNCQKSVMDSAAINCQLQAPADVAYTLWIVDLYAKEANQLSGARVVVGGISF